MLKKIITICLLVCFGLCFSFQQNGFKNSQLKNSRVKAAYHTKWSALEASLKSKNIDPHHFELIIRIFKEEALLEAWVKNKSDKQFQKLASYAICAGSGALGPKRRQGDGQVPEGFYEIAAFQPNSSYHLALKVSYPNKSDRKKATSPDPGGDIMIHGNCVTIGCIPIQDGPIEELYLLATEAKNAGGTCAICIFPFQLTDNKLNEHNAFNKETLDFWKNLKKAFDYFELNHSLPDISVANSGDYVIATK